MLCLLTRDSPGEVLPGHGTYILFSLLGIATSVFPMVVFDFVTHNTCQLKLALILLTPWHLLWILCLHHQKQWEARPHS